MHKIRERTAAVKRPPSDSANLEAQREGECPEQRASSSPRRKGFWFENTAEGLFQSTPGGRFIEANPAMARILGFDSPRELMNRVTDIAAQVYENPKRRWEFVRRMSEDGAVKQFESRILRPDGEVVWISEEARVVRDPEGRVLYYEGICSDISEVKRLEARCLQAQKMETVGKFVGGVAHDFNNLITVITGFCEVALDQLAEGDATREYLAEIEKAGKSASSLISHLLAFSRMQPLRIETLNLNDTIAGMEKMLSRLIGEEIELVTDLAPDLHPIQADPSLMEQVLMNLAVNAKDAMPKGGRITVQTRCVRLGEDPAAGEGGGTGPSGECIRLTLRDSGGGMDARSRERALEPFFTTKEEGRGTGLGLATVSRIVEQCGGSIRLDSAVGKGTTVVIHLPASDRGRPSPPAGAPVVFTMGRGETILLVEDNDALRNMAAQALDRFGYRVVEASCGRDALTVFEESGGDVDLLLTDLAMPLMSGQDLAGRLLRKNPRLKVIFISGLSDYRLPDPTNALPGRDVNFIGKPFSLTQLARSVRQVLDAE